MKSDTLVTRMESGLAHSRPGIHVSVQGEAYFNFRDQIQIISLSILCLETRTRISFFQSHSSRPGIHISAKEMFDTLLYFHEPATIG